MDWVMHGDIGVERWMEYESLLTNTLAETGCLALCQYDRRVCSPTVILNGIRTHPIIICGHDPCENFYFVPPEEFLAPDFSAHEVERRLRNLQEREKTVRELKLFRALIDRSNDAIGVVDPTTRTPRPCRVPGTGRAVCARNPCNLVLATSSVAR